MASAVPVVYPARAIAPFLMPRLVVSLLGPPVCIAIVLPFDEESMVELFRKIVKADFAYPKWMSQEAICKQSHILFSTVLRRHAGVQRWQEPSFIPVSSSVHRGLVL